MYRKLHYAIWCGHHIHVPQQGIWNLIFIFVVMRGQQDVWVDEAVNCVILKGKLVGALFYSTTIAQLDDATPKDRLAPSLE